MSQTFQQRRALRAYCAVQRTARSEHRSNATGTVVTFPTAPGVPGSEPQPAQLVNSIPFLLVAAIFAGFVLGLRIAGWL